MRYKKFFFLSRFSNSLVVQAFLGFVAILVSVCCTMTSTKLFSLENSQIGFQNFLHKERTELDIQVIKKESSASSILNSGIVFIFLNSF